MGNEHLHDKLFRTMFGRAEVARAHFEALLPARLIAAFRWDSLELRPESYISPQLLDAQSDVLYRVRLDSSGEDEVFLYVLLEHQRKRDYAMAFRLLSYMVRIWERWLRDNGTPTRARPLPFIVPMVLYNGARRWPVSTRFQDLLPQPMRALLLPHIPDGIWNWEIDTASKGQAVRMEAFQ